MVKVELVEKKGMTSYVWTFFGLKKVAVKIVSRLYKDFTETRLSLEVVTLQICLVTYEISTLKIGCYYIPVILISSIPQYLVIP